MKSLLNLVKSNAYVDTGWSPSLSKQHKSLLLTLLYSRYAWALRRLRSPDVLLMDRRGLFNVNAPCSSISSGLRQISDEPPWLLET